MALPASFLKTPRTIPKDTPSRKAAILMEKWNVGSLIVVEDDRPIGIVTDRDLALYVLCSGLDPDSCTVADYMSSSVITLREDETLSDASIRMRAKGIRRLPVVDREGRLLGIVTADDLLLVLSKQIGDMAKAVERGYEQESRAEGGDNLSRLGKE